jgi:hypothetical protein
MKITRRISLACLGCLALAAHAQVNDSVRALKLLPAPKDVRFADGWSVEQRASAPGPTAETHVAPPAPKMVIKPSTTILIGNSEDRTAAETLQREIQDRTGMKLPIEAATAAPRTTGHISLGRLTDRGLRAYLESQGVKVEGEPEDGPDRR